MQRGTRQPFFPTNHVRDAHVVVVHHVGKVVGGQPVSLHQHLVVHHAGLERHTAADGVVERHVFFHIGRFEPDHERGARSLQLGHLRFAEREAVSERTAGLGVVLKHVRLCSFAQRIQLLRGVKRFIRQPLVEQVLHGVAVQFASLALAIWPACSTRRHPLIGGQTAPRQRFFDVRLSTLHKPALVGVFDAQNEGSTVGAGEQPVVQRSPDTTHVEWPGGARGKANSNVSHGRQR